jgi:hypothetical protein
MHFSEETSQPAATEGMMANLFLARERTIPSDISLPNLEDPSKEAF